MVGIDGRHLQRLSTNKMIESSPAWSPSGSRIAFVEAKPDRSWPAGLGNLFATGNRIREMNGDGSCGRTIRSAPPVALYGVAWLSAADAACDPLSC